jgi:hypothetical protein
VSEGRSHNLERILGRVGNDEPGHIHSHTSERQQSAQSFNLHVEFQDGRQADGFAWSHYTGYQWRDFGEGRERLVLIFGARAIEIEGQNLEVLVDDIREGQLNGIHELTSAQAELLKHANPENEAVIARVRCYPDFEEVLKEIKGEQEEHETRHARRAQR